MVTTARRTGGVVSEPLRHVLQTPAVSAALAPYEESPDYGVTHRAPCGWSLTPDITASVITFTVLEFQNLKFLEAGEEIGADWLLKLYRGSS